MTCSGDRPIESSRTAHVRNESISKVARKVAADARTSPHRESGSPKGSRARERAGDECAVETVVCYAKGVKVASRPSTCTDSPIDRACFRDDAR